MDKFTTTTTYTFHPSSFLACAKLSFKRKYCDVVEVIVVVYGLEYFN
jgi:hypothetical protein